MKDNRVKRKFFYYLLSMLGLLLLVGIAFMGPQMVFQTGDYYLWQDTELSERETMDIALLTNTYEQSKKQRLKNFAEGLERGEKYYVTSKELSESRQESSDAGIVDRLEELKVTYNEIFLWLQELELLPLEHFWEGYYINSCRQYVIYSDNYARGVNFITWCLEMEAVGGSKMTLLIDAEDGVVYAMKFHGLDQQVRLNPNYKFLFDNRLKEHKPTQVYMGNVFCHYYGIIDDEEFLKYMQETDKEQMFFNDLILKSENNTFLLEIPYGEYSLEFDIRPLENYWGERVVVAADGSTEYTQVNSIWSYLPTFPRFVSGITDINRLIPEFAEETKEE